MNDYLICEICKKIKGKDFNRHENDYFCWEQQRYHSGYYNSKHSIIKERVEDKIEFLGKRGEIPNKNQLFANEIGIQLIYDFLFDIQSKQTCYGWRIQKDYVYRTQLFYDEYDQENYFGHIRGHYFSISDLTAYPFLIKVITITDHEAEIFKIKTPLNSDIYCFVHYNKENGESILLGWVPTFELKKNFLPTLKCKEGTITISRNQTCPNFRFFLQACPEEYEWQSKRSFAHKVLGTVLQNIKAGSRFISEPGYYSIIRTDHWGKDDFFEVVNTIHHVLFQKGYNDDDIIQKKISLSNLLDILKESLKTTILLHTTKKGFEDVKFTDSLIEFWKQ